MHVLARLEEVGRYMFHSAIPRDRKDCLGPADTLDDRDG